jgi:hypothetical protein
MADVATTPPRSVPPSLASRQSAHPITRELAFHSAAPSHSHPGPPYRAAPTLQTSSVHASPHLSTGSIGPVGSSSASSVQTSPRRSMNTQSPLSLPSPPRIKVKSLSHIQSFVIDDANPLSPSRNPSRIAAAGRDISPQYEISEMPVAEIIEMVAGLLTKITTTNDRQHEYLHRHIPPSENGQALSQQTTSVLAFHGKNVPSISILSYLSRIHKYCPTTYEVFLSLLVYFDRMTERVNSGPIQSLRQANQQSVQRHRVSLDGRRHGSISASSAMEPPLQSPQTSTPPPSGSLGASSHVTSPVRHNAPPSPPLPIYPALDNESTNLSHFFVVDSFNIHRLVIAGVTCASKFFSDIFYTNSRYAKVRVSLRCFSR